MSNQEKFRWNVDMDRREFMRKAGLASAAVMMSSKMFAQPTDGKPAELKIAQIGVGSQGRNLMNNCLKIEGVRYVAVCDIWDYHQKYAANILKKYKQPVNVYTDYKDMLAKETDIDAVIVSTPDWMHAEHAIACLEAGLDVYCEKEMSNDLEKAKAMVLAQRKTGKLLQIGHQRRSNPRYHHALQMIEKDKILGKITHINGQWNRPVTDDIGWPKSKPVAPEVLAQYGYEDMQQFRNWRWYKKYAGGPIADLGSHQIDIFSWFLHTPPKSLMASGGADYYPNREWYDNVMTIYEYATKDTTVRAFYQVLNTSSYGGFFECFMGDEGTMVISENADIGSVVREFRAKKREWEDESEKIEKMGKEAIELKLGETLDPSGKRSPEAEKMMANAKKPVHQLHLENFFNAVRANDASLLTCPPEVGYETAVSVLRINDAVAARKTLDFDPADFVA